MRFQPDIAREIMMAVEECPTDIFDESISLSGRGFEDPEVSYHVRILADYGYLEVRGTLATYDVFIPLRITAAGVDFVKTFHDPSLWQQAKQIVLERAPAPTLALLTQCGKALLKTQLGI